MDEPIRTEEVVVFESDHPRLLVRVSDPSEVRSARSALLAAGTALTIGSAASADLTIRHPTVSGRHCQITHRGAFVELVDLGSRNGIVIAGSRVERARIGPGASVMLGRVLCELLRAEDFGDEALSAEPLPGMVGRSAPMLRLAALVRRFAPLGLPVLIRGESGSGKELVARSLHDQSGRKGQLVALNGGAISAALAESELFGHRRGAFTGALTNRAGAFREADGGTLFVDEVAALPLEVQAKLLRTVEDGRVRPLGAEGSRPVDVRIIAATCEPIEALVDQGGFRADLFERLAVCVLRVPPLRDRRSDIPLLARALLEQLGFCTATLSRAAERTLEGLTFRGNVRELRNVLACAAVHAAPGRVIDDHHVERALRERGALRRRVSAAEALAYYEASGGSATAAAKRLGLPRTTVRDLVRRARALRTGR
jgi:DNA-binding NtrC family response regulator